MLIAYVEVTAIMLERIFDILSILFVKNLHLNRDKISLL